MDEREALKEVVPLPALLGYLNFSEGKPDARFQKLLSDGLAALDRNQVPEPWKALYPILRSELALLHQGQGSAFRDVHQAQAVLDLAYKRVLPAYRQHHADLLFHLKDAELFQPFFLARVFEATLAQRGPWQDEVRIVTGALQRLNDYVGHRPIAILETRPEGEPYDHERVCPIPLFIHGAGVASGKFQKLVQMALDILEKTDAALCQEAYFSLELMEELALDPRGYDFEHPADRRPNYVFGEWDPHRIDNQGRYRRYILRPIILEGLLQRVEESSLDREETFQEAATVLAGTILMATGVSGAGPSTHDSSTTLSTLVPRIARYREAFYAGALEKLGGVHEERLRQEAARTRQPFGGARQHLNQHLAQQRAWQLQQKHLAWLFAELGFPAAGRRQMQGVSTASIRLLVAMHLHLAAGRLHVERGELDRAAALLPDIEDLLRRSIACGAMVDPWNILGFQGQYPRFTALEDSVRDHRIDELVQVMDKLFNLYSLVLSEGAARGTLWEGPRLLQEMKCLAQWWDRFATVTVGEVPRVHGGEATASADHVSKALSRWRQRGEATADLAFWREHLEGFVSPKAFALVVQALLEKEDYQAAMALLLTWLAQAEQVPLEEGEHSFHVLALRWMLAVCGPRREREDAGRGQGGGFAAGPSLELVCKFFDYLEANAEDYWNVPRPEQESSGAVQPGQAGESAEEDLYQAAYENVTYQDSTGDEVEAEVLDFLPQKDFDLASVAEHLEKRLRFLATLARLWNLATRSLRLLSTPAAEAARGAKLREWWARARANYQELMALLDTIHQHDIPGPSGSYDSVVEFDRRRIIKERLVGMIIGTSLDMALAVGTLQGALGKDLPSPEEEKRPSWEPWAIRLEQALLAGDPARARELLPHFIQEFQQEPLLYTPLGQGGNPRAILRASMAQIILRGLVINLPRIGLVRETFELLRSAQLMEQNQSLEGPRVTEFDQLFQAGCRAAVEAALAAAASFPLAPAEKPALEKGQPPAAQKIAVLLETIIEAFLSLWIQHSKTLRLGALERLTTEKEWAALCDFIRRYGGDLFKPRFMALANLRGILHRGLAAFLDYLEENPDPLHPVRLIEELDRKIPRRQAEAFLEITLQTLVENYEEYRDYNAITTQSDFGENLYQLLDFLRLKTSYERNSWQLQPLDLVHEVLVRRQSPAAELWREQVEALTRELAEEHLRELRRLEKEHGMYLRTVADRLQERFIRMLEVDRLCALVEPAMDLARQGADHSPLEEALKPFVENPSGAGFEMPFWLRRLETEVQRVRNARTDLARLAESFYPVPKIAARPEDLREQFRDWEKEK